MLIPPTAQPANFPAVTQAAKYTLDTSQISLILVTSIVFDTPNSADGFFSPELFPGSAFPGDATLAKPIGLQLLLSTSTGGASVMAVPTSSTLAGLPDLEYDNNAVPPAVEEAIAYVIPFSAALNPGGYTYQTLGSYITTPGDGTVVEGYFSTGVPTLTALPTSGTATYTGKLAASAIDAIRRDPGSADGSVNVLVDFTTMSVTITTSTTTNLSNNAPTGALPTAAPGLDFSGALIYVAGSNTFSGQVTANNGMMGNVTGRFYGAGIGATTSTKAVGSPPEIGGTFALFASGVEAMQGAFGGN